MAKRPILMNGAMVRASLADVQPGGRVRLGDQAELDRLEFQAWARELLPCPFCGNSAEFVPYKDNGLTLKCKSMGCIQRNQRTLRYGIDWLRTSMAEHWNTRALSAQPSPGGQGGLNYERMFVDACAALAEVSRELGCDPEQGGAEPILAAIAELRESVAARQPVGEQRAALWVQFAENGNMQFFTRDPDRAVEESFCYARPLTAYYEKPFPIEDLSRFKDLIGFAAWQAIQLPETDPRRDFIRQSNELIRIIDSAKEISK
ncbi:TPA: Lar family restriction alleviation protein [Stenotrophomonas maltophilia]|nr:Lar family restriction alleviation protein [Stenotrophomonas maltophilia]HDS1020215.1 Lar family restriction alleviation protein [Stenotrophomonas maltophilia]